jgi:hypothetical protein
MAKGIPPTVGNFFVVLSSLLTQYDSAQEARARKDLGHQATGYARKQLDAFVTSGKQPSLIG